MMATARNYVSTTPFETSHYLFGTHAAYKDFHSFNWGVKLFRGEIERDKNFDLQERAWFHGFAPAIAGRFSEVTQCGIQTYGFLTEAIPMTEQERFYKRKYLDFISPTDYNGWWKKNRSCVHDLNKKLEYIGISSNDNSNWANIGYLRGELVTIDFSLEGWIPN